LVILEANLWFLFFTQNARDIWILNKVLFWTCLLLLSRVDGPFGIPKQEFELPNNVASPQIKASHSYLNRMH